MLRRGKATLQSKADQTTKIDELIRKTEQQVVRASDIIEHVRNLVCTDEVYLQAVPLDHVLEKVVQIMEPELEDSGIGIERIHPADFPLVLADTLEIQLVLVNLLQNAMRSVQPLGDPAERVVNIEVRQISDHKVRVSVADRGGGVSLDEAEHIFEPLHSGRGDGMGMGLAICQTILTAHGGHIWYMPNPAGGAIFHFTLQIAAA